MYQFTNTDAHSFTDFHKNTFDGKIYPGNISEKVIEHKGNIVITDPLECVYCNQVFTSRNQIFRHLGYCNVDVRPRKKKLKQTKITKYLLSCSDYDADTEIENENFHMEIDGLSDMVGNLLSNKNKMSKQMKSKYHRKKRCIKKKTNLSELFKNFKI